MYLKCCHDCDDLAANQYPSPVRSIRMTTGPKKFAKLKGYRSPMDLKGHPIHTICVHIFLPHSHHHHHSQLLIPAFFAIQFIFRQANSWKLTLYFFSGPHLTQTFLFKAVAHPITLESLCARWVFLLPYLIHKLQVIHTLVLKTFHCHLHSVVQIPLLLNSLLRLCPLDMSGNSSSSICLSTLIQSPFHLIVSS